MSGRRIAHRVSVVRWKKSPGLDHQICKELCLLGYETDVFRLDTPFSEDTDILFSFAPYGRLMEPLHWVATLPRKNRPFIIHWNFESLPNLRIPWCIMVAIGSIRSSVDRINDKEKGAFQKMLTALGVCSSYHRMAKFRYLGEYIYALKHGHLDLLFESSLLHANLYRKHGTPVDFIPWGTSPDWYSDLKLERDIDVIWFGKGRTRQRSRLLRKIINELSNQGISTYVADNVENPFIYGEQRTHLLNRAKITLNLSPTWYDPGFPFRFHLAAANKSLVISDPFLPHFPIYREGQHYISVPKEDLTPTIIEYLDRDEKRGPIVENAYNLVTRELTLSKSIKTIMDSVERTLHKRID